MFAKEIVEIENWKNRKNDILLIIEKAIRVGICHAIYRHAKADNKYLKDKDRIGSK